MANDLTTTNGNYLATDDDYFARLAATAQGLKGGGDGKAFMKFNGNDGEYSYGADDESLPLGSEMAVNMRSAQWGWLIWVDGNVEHEEMVPMIEPQPRKADLPDCGPYGKDDGPAEQYTIEMRMVTEPFVNMVFQGNNSSKKRAIAALMKDFASSYKLHPGMIPIIELEERPFETTTEGKGKGRKITKHAPVFKITDWISEEELTALTEGDPSAYEPEPEPAPPSRRVAAPAAQPEPRARRAAAPEPEADIEEDMPPARAERRARQPEPELEPEEAPRARRREPEPAEESAPPAARRRGGRF
jgi:hypothetical protein